MINQDDVFKKGEADQWFQRNAGALSCTQPQKDVLLDLLKTFQIHPEKALEVGGSNGARLFNLQQALPFHATVVEPSAAAIADGKTRFPSIEFHQALASDLPFEDSAFDLVIAGFVMCWIDRASLLRSVSEMDRVLKPGGFLAILDFFPPRPHRVGYHHLEGSDLWTYKQNYPNIFLSTNLYHLVGHTLFDHSSKQAGADVSPRDRVSATVLRKQLSEGYQSYASLADCQF